MELELAAVEWAMRKCRLYLLGLPHFRLVVDHQALVTILDKYTLDAVENPKLQRLKERLSPFIFTTEWRRGRDHAIPDALSRAPVHDPGPDDEAANTDASSFARHVVLGQIQVLQRDTDDTAEPDHGTEPDHLPDPMLDQLRMAAAADADYRDLVAAISSGFPTPRDKTPMSVRQYWVIREALSVDNGIALFGRRIIVPLSARREVLGKLHAAHQGIVRMKRRARQTVYWPGISNEITF